MKTSNRNKRIKTFNEFAKKFSGKSKCEITNAILWMEEHWESIKQWDDESLDHPALVFSMSITNLSIAWAKKDDQIHAMLIDWLCDNKQYPFGFILKVRAYRKIYSHIDLLNQNDIKKFHELLRKVNELKYRPREIIYLDKIMKKLNVDGRSEKRIGK